MEIPFDIVDLTFSFLISDTEALIRCSEAHPIFSRMVEKYQYYQIVIQTGETDGPSYFTKLLSDNARIATYVRVLQVQFRYRYQGRGLSEMAPYLEQIALILPMFPLLECLVLATSLKKVSWEEDIPQSFRKAVEGCLRLPTLQEVHICCADFPLSMLDNHANVNYLEFSGTPQISDFADTTYPHLKSLSVENLYNQPEDRPVFVAWAIRHIAKLQSLRYDSSSNEPILDLENCSNTLNNLDLTLCGSKGSEFATIYDFKRKHSNLRSHLPISINLSSLPHLQHLTICAAIYFDRENTSDESCVSFLPAAMEILKTSSSLQQVTLEIVVDLGSGYIDCDDFKTIDDVNLSPLAALAQSPRSFQHIDLYFDPEDWDFTLTEIVSLLARRAGLTELIEQGVLVVHLGAAPVFLDMVSKRTEVEDQRSIVRPFAYHPSYWY